MRSQAHAMEIIVCAMLIGFPLWSPAPAVGLTSMVLLSCFILARHHLMPLQTEDWAVIIALLAVPGVTSFGLLVHHDSLWVLDRPARLLFGVPIFLAVRLLGFDFHRFTLSAAAAAVGSAGIAIVDLLGGLERASGQAGHPIVFGNTALLFGLLCVWSLMSTPNTRGRLAHPLFLLGVISGVLASIASGSRGGWIALPPLLMLMLILAHQPHRLNWKLLIGLAAGFLLIGALLHQQIYARLTPVVDGLRFVLSSSDAPPSHLISVVARLDMWREALDAWRQSPWIGIGPDQFIARLSARAEMGFMEPGRVHAHNEFLTQSAWFGVMGVLGLMTLLLGFVKGLSKAWRNAWASAGLIVTASFFLFGLTDSMFSMMNRVELYTVLLALCAGAARHEQMAQVNERKESQDSQAGHCQA